MNDTRTSELATRTELTGSPIGFNLRSVDKLLDAVELGSGIKVPRDQQTLESILAAMKVGFGGGANDVGAERSAPVEQMPAAAELEAMEAAVTASGGMPSLNTQRNVPKYTAETLARALPILEEQSGRI